jgi:hypothetical protein
MKKLVLSSIIAVTVLTSVATEAKVIRLPFGKITNSIATDGKTYGGCIALINFDIKKTAPSCSSGSVAGHSYVSFSCTGDLQPEETGLMLFEQAQMAQLMGKEVRFEIDDAKKHNGFCMVTRAEIRTPVL